MDTKPPCKGRGRRGWTTCNHHTCYSSLRHLKVDLGATSAADAIRPNMSNGHLCYDMGWELAQGLHEVRDRPMMLAYAAMLDGCRGLNAGFNDFVKHHAR